MTDFTSEQVEILHRSLSVYTNVHKSDYIENLERNLLKRLNGTEPETLTPEEVEMAIKAVEYHMEQAGSTNLLNGYFEASMTALVRQLSSLYNSVPAL